MYLKPNNILTLNVRPKRQTDRQTETIRRKCQSLFSEKKKKKNVINLSSAEFAHKELEVKVTEY